MQKESESSQYRNNDLISLSRLITNRTVTSKIRGSPDVIHNSFSTLAQYIRDAEFLFVTLCRLGIFVVPN